MFDPEVTIEIKKLGSDRFADRQKAHKKLMSMKERPIQLLSMCQQHRDAEIAYRSNQLLKEQYRLIVPSWVKKVPWIDCLPKDFPNRDEVLYDSYLKHGWPRFGEEWNGQDDTLRAATQDFAECLLLQGWSQIEVFDVLVAMAKNEEQWHSIGGRYNYPPDFEN